MSRQRSRSPLHSRTSAQLRRRDGYYGEQYHATMRSDPWRGSESVVEGGVRWDNESSKAEEQVDHWAKFIEAIDRAGKRKSSSMSKCQTEDGVQNFEENSACSQRQLTRGRLSSSEALHYNLEMHDRIRDPGLRRNEHNAGLVGRRYLRSSGPQHSHGKRHSRVERGYHNEEHDDRYGRSPYNERSMKSNFKEHQLNFKGFQDLNTQEEYTVSRRGISPHFAPVIVEHGHGIQKDARIHSQGRDRERQRSRDSAREHGRPRNHDPGIERERPRSRDLIRDRERPRIGNPVREREHPRNRTLVSQQEHLRSRGPSRDQEYPRSRGSVGPQENSRSHDPIRDQEHPMSSGSAGHHENPRSHDPIRDQEHPRSRDPLRGSDLSRDRGYPKRSEPLMGRDPSRGRESSKSKEPRKHGRDYISGSSTYHMREDSRFHTFSAIRGIPLQGMRQNKEQPRMGSHPREPHEQRAVDDQDFRIDESNRSRASVHDWDEETQPGGVLGQGNILERNQHRNPNHPGARMDFVGHETLKIKVDMSRPLHQSSHLGYSPERQLSFDLVNVGRQRLDFLPMRENSGTFTETPVHSGTFAQEIITLVHHVKENYFQGQGITLNERFSNEQEYSLVDVEEQEGAEGAGPIINRPLGSTSSDTQIFCKIGSIQSQQKPHVPAPGDLRHDLERKRQERLEGVKITIAGGSFSQILPQSQENESVFVGEEAEGEADWSEEVSQQTELWDKPHPKRPIQNFNTRRNFTRRRGRPGPRVKRKANNGAQW